MIEKKINLLPSEQKTYLFQQKAKLAMIGGVVVLLLSLVGFEYYLHHLDQKESDLITKQSELQQTESMIKAMGERIQTQEELIQILDNKDFPIHDFLLTLSTQIPTNLWLYSVSGEDYVAVEEPEENADGTIQNGQVQPPATNQTQTATQTQSNTNTNGQSQATQTSENATSTQTPSNTTNETNNSSNGQEQGRTQGEEKKKVNPKAHKTLVIRGAGTSPTEVGQFVQVLNAKTYIKKATLSSVEEYLANDQVYQAFEIRVEGL